MNKESMSKESFKDINNINDKNDNDNIHINNNNKKINNINLNKEDNIPYDDGNSNNNKIYDNNYNNKNEKYDNENNYFIGNNIGDKNINDNESMTSKEKSNRETENNALIKSNYYENCESLKISEEPNDNTKNSKLSQNIDSISKNKNKKDSRNNNNSPFEKYTNSENINNNQYYNNKNNNYINDTRNVNYNKSNIKKNRIINNKYNNNNNENSEKNKYEYKYNNNINNNGNNILYKDFFYKEIKYGSDCSSSSNRSSINSQSNNSNYSEQGDIRKSYPEDNKINNDANELSNNKEPEDEFSKNIFKQINNIRRNPKSFINKIESSIKNITIDKRNNCIYKGKQKIALNNGEYAFQNTIKHLKVLKSMDELIYNPNMNIKLPYNEEEINNRNYQHDMIQYLLQKKIRIYSFWREVVKDPDECILLMIVDDCGANCGLKRKDLLDPSVKYIGINSVKIGKYFACYITLSK